MRGDSKAGTTTRPGWAFPSGLDSLVAELGAGVPDIDVVIDSHTRFPLHAPFLTPADQGALREHYKGRTKRGVAAHVGMISRGLRSRMAVCLDCVQLDSKENGYSIWRRLHLMPGIFACPLHERPLLTFCDSCESGHRRTRTNWRPSMRCICGGPLKPLERLEMKELDAAIRIANMADKILRTEVKIEVSATTITSALSHHFGGRGHEARARLADALEQSLGMRSLSLLGVSTRTIKRLLGTSNECSAVRNPVQNLAAIYAAFGNLGDFSARLALVKKPAKEPFAEVVDIKTLARRRCRRLKGEKYLAWVDGLSESERSSLKFSSRRWLLNQIAEHPGIGRSGLWRQVGNYSALRYLLHVDRVWFDSLLPAARQRHKCVTKELMHLEVVERLKEHINRRYALSLSGRPWQRVTKTFLLTGAASESSGSLAIESEEIVALLATYIETPAMRLKRLTKMVCGEVTRRRPGHPFGDETTYSGLNHKGCTRRLQKTKKWLLQNAN